MTDQQLHEAALSILAHRMQAQGRAAEDYTSAELLEAAEEAKSRLESGELVLAKNHVLDQALAELGFAPPGDETVTEPMLRTRSHEILQERGFDVGPDKDGFIIPPEPEQIDAMKAAIEELGKPGEKRKDIATARRAEARELLVRGIVEGVVSSASAAVYGRRVADEPEEVIAELRAKDIFLESDTPPSAYRDPEYAAAARRFTTPDGTVRPDEETTRQHMAAEKLLRSGGAEKDGKLEYSEADYYRAIEVVQAVGLEGVDALDARVTGALRARGIGVAIPGKEYRAPTPDEYLHEATWSVGVPR